MNLSTLNSVTEKKKLATIFVLYELSVFMFLPHCEDVLDRSWCYRDNTDYIAWGILLPILFGLFVYWRKELNISDHTMNIIENILLIVCLIVLMFVLLINLSFYLKGF